MLTIKQITENTDAVIRGLEKKHFKNAKEAIEQVLAYNNKRKSTQAVLDNNLAEVNSLSKSIGQLMKEGKKEEAETAKARVGELKEANKTLQADMDQAAQDLQQLLYTTSTWVLRLPAPASPSTKAKVHACNAPSSTSSWTKHATRAIPKSCRPQW